MKEKDITYFKTKIEEEIEKTKKELPDVGVQTDKNGNDWEARGESDQINAADPNEVADEIEAYDENTAVLEQLETKLNDLREALIRIENKTYGICEISGEEIERERLEANPAARTCIVHREERLN